LAEQCCSVGISRSSGARKMLHVFIWGPFMKDLVIELILIAMIAMPLVAESLEPCRAARRKDSEPIRKLRRSN
ncbi:MAG: hypothetical protein P4K93_14530, partial [Terracidiphilus sp.]|nr:hypothetical protein [Terracidiphilus sp.]